MTTNQPDEHLEAFSDDDADSADFASEHEDSTLADEVEGGPEGSPEPESPRGRAGMD
ncbi:hypothetical protein [Dactylosporangium sp. NPDC051541]|uniref:hypothetical protein n=1 Tax=Dactylosporangium sp. NPDC051541 TaxID=3363977 RepID=UPI0037B68EEA